MRNSHQGEILPVVVDSYPIDVSVYGVRGMAGNLRDWCQDVFSKEVPPALGERVLKPSVSTDELAAAGPDRVFCGGSWYDSMRRVRAAYRRGISPSARDALLGFRLARGPV